MKVHFFIFGSAMLLISCKKEASKSKPEDFSLLKHKVMTMSSKLELSTLTKSEKIQILTLLDADGSNGDFVRKIKTLQNDSTKVSPASASGRLENEETTVAEFVNSFYNFSSTEDPDGECSSDFPYGTEWPAPFTYKWTVGKSLLGAAKVISYEKLKLFDLGTSLPASSRWAVNSIIHQTSYMLGVVGNATYFEVDHQNYYNGNGHHFYVKTLGVVTGAGMAKEVESERYVNTGVAVESNGKLVQ